MIVTEHYVQDHEKDNILSLEVLKDGNSVTFNDANKDLYEYMKALHERGKVEVVMISGDTRKREN